MSKWRWKMKWCKANRLPPASDYAWSRAEKAYIEHLKIMKYVTKNYQRKNIRTLPLNKGIKNEN